ncbi:nucleotidyltransferase domain-containing protein [Haloimpatiens massiliensis]|uniref:nucleotidyltransferase domain-containing protein n=1 Tax=Haloimpatiens massiliensis TaxID=1658110 RepID=UPI000C85CD99|nr:nucleotidyltransferase domain-containing protein [Haloimpatiens massiliensis]
MTNTILQYQKAFNNIVDRLKSDKSVLAVMVFGSMVTGDLWDESDIDLFVVKDDEDNTIKNIYTREKNVPIHIKLMSKEKFINLQNEDLKGGFLHRIFSASRLVFSKDMDITNRYDRGRFYPDLDREIWNMIYLAKALKNIGVCKKYLANNRIYTAYTSAIKCSEDFAKLKINSSGYMVSKDVMSTSMNIDENFRVHVDELFFNNLKADEGIRDAIAYIEAEIDKDLRNITGFLLEYIREKDSLLSAEDIKRDKLFKDFDIDMEEILNKLWEKNLLKKETRDYKSSEGNVLFKENVYFV